MPVAETGAAVVEIRISARPALIPTIRAVASDLAGRADFDLDAISDLRMAVDEACTTLVALAATDGTLSCKFVLNHAQIEVTVSTATPAPGAEVRTDSFGWRVLQTLADEVTAAHGIDGEPDAIAIRLTKRAGATQ
ncbi:MAG: serine/threonine-protein kinase RsbW [Pseudonocardiales bacterium]|nr:serine/threonine-protein kinase RsbW [Pseudonocardiales bacterium]MDT7626620.1 serine/threonine-protein kinase RsbW [Pseudonocardiales bacterium]